MTLPGLLLPLLMLTTAAVAQVLPNPPVAPQVPYTVKSPQGDRNDEYYWLRDDDLKAKRPEVMQYLEAENAFTAAWLAPLQGLQKQLVAEMRGRIREDDSTPPLYDHGWWYWREFKTGAQYPLLWRQRGGPEKPDAKAKPQLLLDQPALAAGKAYYKVASAAVSPDGKLLAWTEDLTGRRIHSLRIKNLVTGEMLADTLTGVLSDVVWANDNRTLFYIRQDPVTLQGGPIFRHRLGADPAADAKVYEEADKTLYVSLRKTASSKFVVIHASGFATTETLAVPADRPEASAQVVFKRVPKVRHLADHLGGRWFLRTNEEAINYKLISAPERAPDVRNLWRTLVPGREQATLERFALLQHGVALQERVDADTRVRLLVGGRSVAVAQAPATAVSLGEQRDPAAAHLRYNTSSMVQPASVYDLHLASGQALLRKRQEVPGYDATLYATERLWAPSRDGKRIPVTLAWRRDRAQADGKAPLLIIGYGAYGYSYDPNFSSARASLLDRGFVLAIAHVRGGAELGQGWYEDGRLMNKRNSFNDFIDATDALVKAGWGDPVRVFASGGSAGGLLMGAVANMAGERYRGMVLQVPFVDVMTTMLDASIPLTVNEWTQWGDPREKAAYDYMLSYSPYDNLAAKPYPAMLVTTGLWDSQVQYFEPAKYVARLRARKTDANPLLLHVNMTAGHGGASGRFDYLDEIAREYVFLLERAGLAAR
jgi:oligopeptidase B